MKERHYKFLRVFPLGNCVCLTFALLFATFAAAGQTRAVIHVAPETVVESDRIDLGRISRITGELDKSERLNGISIGYAPAIGMSREITRDQILLSLKAAGFADSDFILDSPAKIVIRRIGQTVTTEQIRSAVEKAILAQFISGNVTARITRLDVPGPVEVPTGKIDVRASMTGVGNLFERFSIPVEIRVDNQMVRSFAATIEVSAFADVIVAAADLGVGRKLSSSDFRLEKTRIEKPVYSYIRNIQGLRGMQLSKPVESGKPVTTDLLFPVNVIKFGDPVRIEARSGSIKIVIAGEARSQGKIGDRIAVKNTQSGAIMQAVILDEGLVRVIF